VVFGGAQKNMGASGMALLIIFGALFCLLTLYRSSLLAGIIMRVEHDLIAFRAPIFLQLKHVLEANVSGTRFRSEKVVDYFSTANAFFS